MANVPGCAPLVQDNFPSQQQPKVERSLRESASGFSKGIAVSYRDKDGKDWNLSNGVQPSGSSFEVISSEAVTPNGTGDLIQKVSGKVSCTLYDASGNSIKLENGEFVYSYAY